MRKPTQLCNNRECVQEIPHLSSFPTSFVQSVLWDTGVLGSRAIFTVIPVIMAPSGSKWFHYGSIRLLGLSNVASTGRNSQACSLRHEKEARLLLLTFFLGAQLISNVIFPATPGPALTFLWIYWTLSETKKVRLEPANSLLRSLSSLGPDICQTFRRQFPLSFNSFCFSFPLLQ